MKIYEKKSWELKDYLKDNELNLDNQITELVEIIKTDNKNIFNSICNDLNSNNEFSNEPLFGSIVALSDDIAIKNEKMTFGSKHMENYVSPYSSTVANLIKNAGGTIIGMTNMDEFGIYPTLKTPYFGKNENIFEDIDLKGLFLSSALAVSNNYCNFALSKDTGGIPRIASSYTNTFSLKPSFGTVSRFGVSALANSMEQVSVIGKDIKDLYEVIKTLAVKDENDQTSIKNEEYNLNFDDIIENKNKLKIAIPKEVFELIKSSEIKNEFEDLINKLKESEVEIEEIDLNIFSEGFKSFIVLSNSELSSNLMKYDGIEYGYRTEDYKDVMDLYKKSRGESFGLDAKARIILGTYFVSSDLIDEYYKKAFNARNFVINESDKLFEKYDLILTPTTPYTLKDFNDKEELTEVVYNEVFTSMANMIEGPGLSLPINGKQMGIQLIGKRLEDSKVIKGASILKRLLDEN